MTAVHLELEETAADNGTPVSICPRVASRQPAAARSWQASVRTALASRIRSGLSSLRIAMPLKEINRRLW
jgi:hypothetical protein